MTFLEQYADKWIPEPMSGCYLWLGGLRRNKASKHNFPTIHVSGKTVNLPKLLLLEKTGEQPVGHETSHTCGISICVNPDHLRWENHADNMARKTDAANRSLGKRRGCHLKRGNRWVVRYQHKGKMIYVGAYKTVDEAQAAYRAAIKEL